MNRIQAAPRPVRASAALVGVAGVIVLAGCSAGAADTTDTTDDTAATTAPSTAATADTSDSSTTDSTATGDYADGTYTADGTYVDGGGQSETISVTLTLEGDVVTDVQVSGDAKSPQSQQYQEAFIGGVADVVVGKDIDDLAVSKVAGSSLTSGGFNAALETIKAEAAA
ncbi:hypothetical protein ACFQRL_07200 [Microbacterium fluvii]|uniref:FMN-binding domain-containing protein n=1 Tax=Microbacterium fluvii TaxID=415215 RepID=A0ABW2HC85_9MICO|nr:hypothetical protein [Microbacterium fluvii]MCU4672373.1 hypothetical protein [Microbacterium fluvii]